MERTQNVNLLPRVVDCIDCGEPFVISPGERRFYLEHKLKEPLHCFDCRQKRKNSPIDQTINRAGNGGASNG